MGRPVKPDTERKTKAIFTRSDASYKELVTKVSEIAGETEADFVRKSIDERITRLAKRRPTVLRLLNAHRRQASRAAKPGRLISVKV